MNNTKQKGFTLIETLVAISILMIAIAGPLTVANKSYTAAIGAKDQAVAMNLAQESIEYINYIKDNRDPSWGDWEPGTSFYLEVKEPYRSCVDKLNPCWSIAGLPALPSGFFRSYYFDVINLDQISLVMTIAWSNVLSERSVTLTQILTNQHR